MAAAVGIRFAPDDVARLQRKPVATLLPLIDEALGAGVLLVEADLLVCADGRLWREMLNTIPQPVLHCLRQELKAAQRESEDAVPRGPELPAALETAARHFLRTDPATACELAVEAVRLTSRSDPSRWSRAAAAVYALTSAGRLTHAAELAGETLADRDLPAVHPAVVPAATVLSNARWADGEPADALRLGWQAVRAIGDDTPETWRQSARLALAGQLVSLREPEQADALIDAARDDGDRLGPRARSAGPSALRARLLVQAGRIADARKAAESAVESAARTSARCAERHYEQLARSALALAALHAGDLATATAQVELVRGANGAGGRTFGTTHFDWTGFLVTAYQHSAAEVLATMATPLAELLGRASLWCEEPAAAPYLVRLALAAGDEVFAKSVVAKVEQFAAGVPELPTVVCAARHARGVLMDDIADLTFAANRQPDRWTAALAAEDLALRLADRDGDRQPSLDWLKTALRRFNQVGTWQDTARVRNHLRRLGVRPPAVPAAPGRDGWGKALSGGAGWAELTETERSIAYLVSNGLTNRQVSAQIFLSPHTINYYLRCIFRKLNINSRVELAGFVCRDG